MIFANVIIITNEITNKKAYLSKFQTKSYKNDIYRPRQQFVK